VHTNDLDGLSQLRILLHLCHQTGDTAIIRDELGFLETSCRPQHVMQESD
jgi:hypothetical protein